MGFSNTPIRSVLSRLEGGVLYDVQDLIGAASAYIDDDIELAMQSRY